MAELKPTKIDFSEINGGEEYNNGDGVHANSINSAIKASAWAQALGTNQPNIENAGKVGNPSVSIEEIEDGTPRFKFENLKGEALGLVSRVLQGQNENGEYIYLDTFNDGSTVEFIAPVWKAEIKRLI